MTPAVTFASLAAAYTTDPDSTYRAVEHASRIQYDKLCRRLTADIGNLAVAATTTRNIRRLHEDWTERSGGPMAHALISMLRMLTGFGATILEDEHCQRIRGLLSLMRFPMGERRQVFLKYEQAAALCDLAREKGMPSIVLAQALQFETGARQKDIIGAWVPMSDRTPSDLIHRDQKWIKGIRWNEIDADMMLRHKTSKRKKMLVTGLKLAPLVMRELALAYGSNERSALPADGPVIVDERTGRPWLAQQYRYAWRKLATALGIPKDVQNRDSRSGAITESLAAGALPDDTRKFATHSQLSTTMGYSRGEEEASARVALARVKSRGNGSVALQ